MAACVKMTHMAPDLYAYFIGRWHFTRTMLGSDGMLIGNAEGQAEFVAVQPACHLHYKESGQLNLAAGQRVVSFSRRFDYQIAGSVVDVAFADGVQAGQLYQRYRYDAVSQVLLPLSTHLCILDRYDTRYALTHAQHFELHTRIEGPHKDVRLHTYFIRDDLNRAAPAAAPPLVSACPA